MLGSYNDKANEIIQSLPTKKAILQQMDRRFSLVNVKKSPWVFICFFYRAHRHNVCDQEWENKLKKMYTSNNKKRVAKRNWAFYASV